MFARHGLARFYSYPQYCFADFTGCFIIDLCGIDWSLPLTLRRIVKENEGLGLTGK